MFEFNGNNNASSNENNESNVQAQVNILDQKTCHHSRSEKYLHIPTREVLDIFEEMGFDYNEDSLWKVKARKQSRQGKGKHMITLRHPELQVDVSLRDELVPQMYLWNSYDGSLRLKLVIGFYRHVCANTMAFGTGIIDPIVFKHIAGMNNKEFRKKQLKETIQNAAEKFKEMSQYVINLKQINLTHSQKIAFARRMVEIRLLGTNNPEVTLESKGIQITNSIIEEQILKARRAEDEGDSAWLVANVVQESLLSVNNYSEFSYEKTYVNKKNERVTKTRKVRQLKNKVRIDALNMSLFQELNKIVDTPVAQAA